MPRAVEYLLVSSLSACCNTPRSPTPSVGDSEELQNPSLRAEIENLFAAAHARFEPPRSVRLDIAACGEPMAAYLPNEDMVRLCEELLAWPDLALYVAAHHLGHALLHRLEVPISGREEIAVEELTVLALLGLGNASTTERASHGAFAFVENDAALLLREEHGHDHAAATRFACLLVGADPEAHAAVTAGLATVDIERCRADYAMMADAWGNRLRTAAASR